MSAIADIIGMHAVTALVVFSVAMLGATAAVWRAIERLAPVLWRAASRAWEGLSTSALGRRAREVRWLHGTLTRTMTVWRYLGLHALVAFAVALGGLGAFAELADAIGVGEEVASFDEHLLASLRAHVDVPTLEAFARVTRLGDRNLLTILGVAVAAVLLAKRWWVHAAVWVLGTAGGGMLVRILKHAFERTRPIHDHALTHADGWSFPSGHAAGALLVYGMLGYFVARHAPRRWHLPIALVTIALVVFVGFSRAILQVHYLSDVLGGFAAGAAWVALCIAAFEAARRGPARAHLAKREPRETRDAAP